MSSNDLRLFLTYWVRAPLRTGAVLPSGMGLARTMAAQVDADRDGAVVELGAGTGAVTRALLERDIPAARLLVVEHNPAFCHRLRAKFPGLRVLQGDARNLHALLRDQGDLRVGTVVSSLPLRSLRVATQHDVLKESLGLLDNSGTFVQFTYGLASPVDRSLLPSLGLRGRLVERVWRNLPPASVWCYEAAGNAGGARNRLAA